MASNPATLKGADGSFFSTGAEIEVEPLPRLGRSSIGIASLAQEVDIERLTRSP